MSRVNEVFYADLMKHLCLAKERELVKRTRHVDLPAETTGGYRTTLLLTDTFEDLFYLTGTVEIYRKRQNQDGCFYLPQVVTRG